MAVAYGNGFLHSQVERSVIKLVNGILGAAERRLEQKLNFIARQGWFRRASVFLGAKREAPKLLALLAS